MRTKLAAAITAAALGLNGCAAPSKPPTFHATAVPQRVESNETPSMSAAAEKEAVLAKLDVLKGQLLDDMTKVGPLAATCGAWDGDYWAYRVMKAEVKGNLPDGTTLRFADAWNDNLQNPDPVMAGLSCTMVKQMSLDYLVLLAEWSR